MNRYHFREVTQCEMCHDDVAGHRVLGQRLNKSQGLNPRGKAGVSVTVQRCSKCGLVYSNPQSIPFDLQDHYGTPPEDYWTEDYFVWHPEYFARQIGDAKLLLPFSSGMKALDIGAGLGKAMLSLQSAGFDAFGLEPSVPFYQRAISRMGISEQKLRLGAVEELDYRADEFDFITFGAVFEHLYNPASCLGKALTWLKPNGILHLEVPSSDWLIARFLNLYYRIIGANYVTNLSPMHAPFHLHEFTLESFAALSKIQGFKIEKHHYDVCTIYHFPRFLHPVLRKYMDATETGMQLTVYLRKSG